MVVVVAGSGRGGCVCGSGIIGASEASPYSKSAG